MDENWERQRFERWYLEDQDLSPTYQLSRGDNGDYHHYFTQLRWLGWKARAALSVSRIT